MTDLSPETTGTAGTAEKNANTAEPKGPVPTAEDIESLLKAHSEVPFDVASTVEYSARRLEEVWPLIARRVLGPPNDHPAVMLPLAQLRLCSLLLREGRRTMSQIGEDLAISVSAVTQMADRLEKAGLVERVAETDGDRRTRHLQLTAQGEALMNSRRTTRVERAESVLRTLDPARRVEVVNAVITLLDASRQIPGLLAATTTHAEPHL